MASTPRLTTVPALTGIAALALFAATLTAAVVKRDLARQLELVGAPATGRVVFAEVVESHVRQVPGFPFVPFTALKLKVMRHLAPAAGPDELVAYAPGAGQRRLSISPPPGAIRVGERVVLFLRKDAAVSQVDPDAYRIDSFAEVYSVQKNRKGEWIVLGEGAGMAVEENTRLDALAEEIRKLCGEEEKGGDR